MYNYTLSYPPPHTGVHVQLHFNMCRLASFSMLGNGHHNNQCTILILTYNQLTRVQCMCLCSENTLVWIVFQALHWLNCTAVVFSSCPVSLYCLQHTLFSASDTRAGVCTQYIFVWRMTINMTVCLVLYSGPVLELILVHDWFCACSKYCSACTFLQCSQHTL